ncbi:virion structural protein [Pseudomonas phage Noxifer]|uniref:Virion structural protein n=1 Tax=Pseudomonas phage Noxifer TaxID=2006684 RepID=A0A1Y0T0C7_9CAUD|nr:virion structural protein [Pseudomonas phage Noxifer]ARV77249.1 virion structural protein [Pseudomonas phage Noxifer]
MLELLIGLGRKQGAADDSDVPFPAGTPFKGVVPSSSFISGPSLASAIGLSAGGALNNTPGWLHFIEANGLELYIAKKPLRYAATAEQINQALGNGSKEVTINGDVYICRNMTGAISSGAAAVPSNAGGEWNRYMYNVYDQTDRAGIPDALLWGNYTKAMLGIAQAPAGTNDLGDGVFTICAESVTNGFLLRGNDWQSASGGGQHIKGIWNMPANNPQTYYGWRPILIKKSTLPPSVFRGEVAPADLITGPALVAAVGVTTGAAFEDGNPTWLKFDENGKVFYIAKKPLRTGVTWEILNGFGAVYGSKIITIGNKRYRVRLMTGGTSDPMTTGGGEYDAYFSRCTQFYSGVASDRFASYTGPDVGWVSGTGNGQLCLVQEYYSTSGPGTRGYPGFLGVWYQIANTTHAGYAWRPVLEELPPAPTLSDTWAQIATLPAGVNGASACVIGDKMYVFGGQDAAFVVKGTLYEVNLTTGEVLTKASDLPRRYHQAVNIGGKMYVYGGYTSAYTGDVRIYDPATNLWTGGLSGVNSDRHASFAYNNKMYILGGNGGSQLTQARTYTPAGNTWTNYTATGVAAAPCYLGSADVSDNTAYTLTGYNTQKEFRSINLLTNVGKTMPAPPHGVYGHAHGSMKGGIYVFGGTVDTANKDKVTLRYDIVTGVWSYLGAIPYTIGERAASAQDGTNIYLAGGVGSPTAVWRYTP